MHFSTRLVFAICYVVRFVEMLNKEQSDLVPFERMNIEIDLKYGIPKSPFYMTTSNRENTTIGGICNALNKHIIERCHHQYRYNDSNIFCDWNDYLIGYYAVETERARTQNTKFDDLEPIYLSYCYLYRMCYYLRHYHRDLQQIDALRSLFFSRIDYKLYCPHPCGRERCDNVIYSLKGSCTDFEYAYYDTDYRCSCASPYEWNKESLLCEKHDPCSKKPCKNSEICVDENNGYRCVVEEHYKDGCRNNFNNYSISGNEACTNGKCYALDTIGNFSYKCICKERYMNDNAVKYPNCYRRVSNCSNVKCANGVCDEGKSKCICWQGWQGDTCSNRTGHWLPWSEWSECHPNCSLHRVHERSRKCSSENILDCAHEDEIKDFEIAYCYKEFCPVNGNWTEWATWAECSVKCGLGVRLATRLCVFNITIIYRNDAAITKINCVGPEIKTEKCRIRTCEGTISTPSKIAIAGGIFLLLVFLASLVSLYYEEKGIKKNFLRILDKYELDMADVDFILEKDLVSEKKKTFNKNESN